MPDLLSREVLENSMMELVPRAGYDIRLSDALNLNILVDMR